MLMCTGCWALCSNVTVSVVTWCTACPLLGTVCPDLGTVCPVLGTVGNQERESNALKVLVDTENEMSPFLKSLTDSTN